MIEILLYVIFSLSLCRFFTWLWLYEAPFAQWEDSSGMGNHLVANVGHEPRLTEDGSILFDGVDDSLKSDHGPYRPHTVYTPVINLTAYHKLNK